MGKAMPAHFARPHRHQALDRLTDRRLLRELAAQGSSVLFYTSELEEVQRVCDRAIVIFGGRVVDVLPADIADEAALTRAAYGLPRNAQEGAGIPSGVRSGSAGAP